MKSQSDTVSSAPPIKLLLTMEEAAQALSLSRTLLYALVMRNEIFSVKIGRSRRIPLAALHAFVEHQMAQREGN